MRTQQLAQGADTPLSDSKRPAFNHQAPAKAPLPPKVSGKDHPCPHLLKNLSQRGKRPARVSPGPSGTHQHAFSSLPPTPRHQPPGETGRTVP